VEEVRGRALKKKIKGKTVGSRRAQSALREGEEYQEKKNYLAKQKFLNEST